MAINQLGDGSADGVQLPATKFGAFNATPVAQPTAAVNTSTGAAGSTNTAFLNTTYTGGVGSTGYTVGDVVAALKNLGLVKS